MNKDSPTPNTPDYTPYSPPTAEVAITTDEGIILASRWRRLAAMLINNAILFLPLLPFFLSEFTSGSSDFSSIETIASNDTFLAILGVFYIAILIINIVLIIKKSASIGKVLMKIKIVRNNGEKCSAARIIGLRIIINGIFGMIPALGTFYVIADPLFIFNQRKQCIHDFLADTVVIDA